MTQEKDFQAIFEDLRVVDKLYEFIRLVDPLQKKVLAQQSSMANSLETKCYELWDRGHICENCVSMRAFNENKTFVKIDYSPARIYMVTAIPVEVAGKRMVLELLKDTTDSLLFGSGDYATSPQSTMYALIDNMNSLALKDPLTGVYNRRYVSEKMPIDLVNAAFSKQSIGVIMADIDFFKKVNDNYGHQVGDQVLQEFAGTLLSCITRESDWVARYGGEEFLICLPGAGLERAAEIAEKMRKAVEDHVIRPGDHELRITASFGVCSLKAAEIKSVEAIIQQADEMLYKAKHNGRNRIEVKEENDYVERI